MSRFTQVYMPFANISHNSSLLLAPPSNLMFTADGVTTAPNNQSLHAAEALGRLQKRLFVQK